MFNEIQSYIVQNWIFWYIPFYCICFLYALILIGWFFSTDYYDNLCNLFDDGDLICIHGYFLFLIITNLIAFYVSGATNLWCMIWSGAMWVCLVGPFVVYCLLATRMYLRRKRGKA